MKIITINIKGMHCKSCEILIGDALSDLGAKKSTIDSKKGTAIVEFDEKKLSSKQIEDAIKNEGYKIISSSG